MSRSLPVFIAVLLFQACIPVAAGFVPQQSESGGVSSAEVAFAVFRRQRKALPSVDIGPVSPFSEPEQDALLNGRRYVQENQLLTQEKIQATVEDFNELIAFAQEPGFAEVLEWTGPMEGIEAGMDYQQMTDAYFENMDRVIHELSDEELQQLRMNLVERIDILLRINDGMDEGEDTMGQDEIAYALAHTMILRKKVIQLQEDRNHENR